MIKKFPIKTFKTWWTNEKHQSFDFERYKIKSTFKKKKFYISYRKTLKNTCDSYLKKFFKTY